MTYIACDRSHTRPCINSYDASARFEILFVKSQTHIFRAFKQGVWNQGFTKDIALNSSASIAKLFEMANCYTTTAEAVEWNRIIDRDDKDPRGVNDKDKKKHK